MLQGDLENQAEKVDVTASGAQLEQTIHSNRVRAWIKQASSKGESWLDGRIFGSNLRVLASATTCAR